jgi:Uncharacterised nucleotidyltransferase
MKRTRAPARSKGEMIAIALRGAWRDAPPPLDLDEGELQIIARALLRSGSAALVWWKARRTHSDLAALHDDFHTTYKYQTLRTAIHDLEVKQVLTALRAAGVEAMLIKGWAIARRYPEPALRPYGDLDLCVRPEQFDAAQGVLQESGRRKLPIDLHCGVERLDYESADTLFDRAIIVPGDGTMVLMPSEEDHLRMMCLHLLRHGAWRPIWLCDVALAIETRSAGFDWKRFYGRDSTRREWLGCVVKLARDLLGGRCDEALIANNTRPAPRWLMRTIERRWSRWFNGDYRDHAFRSLLRNRFEPARALEDLYFRCDPLRATVEVSGSFNRLPRLPYQVAAVVRRLPELPMKINELRNGRVRHP